jgi:hypothetical protein
MENTLGEYPELTRPGAWHTSCSTPNFGGSIGTGGPVFVGGSKDEKFHAFDKFTGKFSGKLYCRPGDTQRLQHASDW